MNPSTELVVERHPSSSWALVALSSSMLVSSLGTSVANVLLPELGHAFDATFQATQWVVLAYLLTVTSTVVVVGRLGDSFGRRRVLRAGLVLFSAASIAASLAPSLSVVIAARAAQGLGGAILMASSVALAAEVLPKNATGRAMGLLGSMSAVGTALGPSLGGLVLDALGWRAAFFLMALPSLATLLLSRHLPEDPRVRPKRALDVAGASFLASSLVAYALASTVGRGWSAAWSLVLWSVAVGSLASFVWVERSAERGGREPLLRLSTLRDGGLRASLAASALVSTVLMTTLVVGPFHLSIALGLDASTVGLVMSSGPLVAALVTVPAGRLVDRMGARVATLGGLGAIAVGCTTLAVSADTSSVVGYAAPLLVLTGGYALFQTANNASVMQEAKPEERGVTSGLLTLSRNLGLVTGASLLGALFAFASGTRDVRAASPEAVAFGARVTFGVATVLIVGALAIVSRASRRMHGAS